MFQNFSNLASISITAPLDACGGVVGPAGGKFEVDQDLFKLLSGTLTDLDLQTQCDMSNLYNL
eukprot:Pgem_evm1s8316